MGKRVKQPDPEKAGLERKGVYIVQGEYLLTDHEWNGGVTPTDDQLAKRRAEVGIGFAQAAKPLRHGGVEYPGGYDPPKDPLEPGGEFWQGMANATGATILHCDAEQSVTRPDPERLELMAKAPIRAKVDQADMSDTPLFGQGQLL